MPKSNEEKLPIVETDVKSSSVSRQLKGYEKTGWRDFV